MRHATAFAALALLALAGCSSEQTRTAYVGTSSMDEAEVQQLLKNQGYNDLANLHKNGNDWVGSGVNSSGSPVDFDISQDGVIHAK